MRGKLAILLAFALLAGAPVAHAALVDHWTFDNTLDDGAGSTNEAGTFVGDAAFSTSAKIGSHAVIFDGNGDRVDTASGGTGNELNLTTSLALSAWVLHRPSPSPRRLGSRCLGWPDSWCADDVDEIRAAQQHAS